MLENSSQRHSSDISLTIKNSFTVPFFFYRIKSRFLREFKGFLSLDLPPTLAFNVHSSLNAFWDFLLKSLCSNCFLPEWLPRFSLIMHNPYMSQSVFKYRWKNTAKCILTKESKIIGLYNGKFQMYKTLQILAGLDLCSQVTWSSIMLHFSPLIALGGLQAHFPYVEVDQ